MKKLLLALPIVFSLSACDQVQQKLFGEDAAAKAAREEAEGKAVGGACRHSGRAIEDCYSIYHWLPKSSIFAGWQDMDAYMRSNKIEEVTPQLPPPKPPQAPGKKRKAAASADAISEEGTSKSEKSEKSEK